MGRELWSLLQLKSLAPVPSVYVRTKSGSVGLQVSNAAPSGVSTDAGDVILELGREVRAHAREEAVVRAVAAPLSVRADEEVSIDLSSASLWMERSARTMRGEGRDSETHLDISSGGSRDRDSSDKSGEGSEGELELHGESG